MTDTNYISTTEPTPVNHLDLLAQEIGKFIRYWGFKKIHGRIWCHIYLSPVPLDAGTLMKRLQVSKALMSLSLNDLLDHKVIAEAGKSDRGTQTYVANPNVLDVILNVLKQREKNLLNKIEDCHKKLKDIPEVNPHRLEAMRLMIREAQQTLDGILELSTIDFMIWSQLNDQGQSSH
jgi:DNA-binding transcriptional regulator GbsR (MarR family)